MAGELGSLAMRCPSCGSENPDGKHLCGDCAAPLPSASPAAAAVPSPVILKQGQQPPLKDQREAVSFPEPPRDGERKTITALFADIKGSMELIEDLDPEEAREIIDPALRLMIDAVHHYGGHVAQSTGD